MTKATLTLTLAAVATTGAAMLSATAPVDASFAETLTTWAKAHPVAVIYGGTAALGAALYVVREYL